MTGYRQTTVYETGITGYSYDITGTIEVLTGREMLTGSLTAGTPHDTGEGARYFKYYTLNNGDVETAYKEELGFLHPDSGYQYLPTGDGAFATLGLRPVSGDITPYAITEGIKTGGSVFINLYGSVAQTGITSNVSGVAQTAVTQTLTIPALDTSGINLLGDSEFLKKKLYLFFRREVMIYDYTLSTGDSTISGCFSSELGTDRGDKMNLAPVHAAKTFYFR